MKRRARFGLVAGFCGVGRCAVFVFVIVFLLMVSKEVEAGEEKRRLYRAARGAGIINERNERGM